MKIGDWVEIISPPIDLPQPPSKKLIGENGFVISSPYTAHRLAKSKDAWETFWVFDVGVVFIYRVGLRLTTHYYRIPAVALKKLTSDPDTPKSKNVNPYHSKTLTKQQFAKLWELRFQYMGKNGAKKNYTAASYLTQVLEQDRPPLMNPPNTEIALAIRRIIHPCVCIDRRKPLDFNCPFHGPDIKDTSGRKKQHRRAVRQER